MRKSFTGIVVVMCGFGFAVASSGSASGTGPVHPLRLTVATVGPIGSLDPRHGDSVIAREVWNLQYPTLTALDPQSLDPAPGLAAAWSPAPHGRGWIYNLRPGLTWSDGQRVTAADVAYSINQAREARWPYVGGMLDGLTAHALNVRSVEVTSRLAHASFPGLLVHVVPEHVFAKVADLDRDITKLGVSDGPWHVVGETAGSVRLDATGSAGPALQQIDFRTYGDAAALVDALARGAVDVISGLPDADIGRVETLSHVTVDHASDSTEYVLFDDLTDVRVRQAISLAIDRTELVATVMHGVGTPGVVPTVATGSSWALDDGSVQSLTAALDAQPGRARQLLAGSSRITTVTLAAPTDPTSRQVAAFIRDALANVGIHTVISSIGSPADGLSLRHTTISTDPTAVLHGLSCDVCPTRFAQYSSSIDATTRLDAAHDIVQHATEQAT
ncbi:MAG TPA: ABC transporter substrate-binding protein, partial [Acidimicrobiia bacterium]|nr:ABC transporter substrate-binding protein [Acidimicrobiia bacterium]